MNGQPVYGQGLQVISKIPDTEMVSANHSVNVYSKDQPPVVNDTEHYGAASFLPDSVETGMPIGPTVRVSSAQQVSRKGSTASGRSLEGSVTIPVKSAPGILRTSSVQVPATIPPSASTPSRHSSVPWPSNIPPSQASSSCRRTSIVVNMPIRETSYHSGSQRKSSNVSYGTHRASIESASSHPQHYGSVVGPSLDKSSRHLSSVTDTQSKIGSQNSGISMGSDYDDQRNRSIVSSTPLYDTRETPYKVSAGSSMSPTFGEASYRPANMQHVGFSSIPQTGYSSQVPTITSRSRQNSYRPAPQYAPSIYDNSRNLNYSDNRISTSYGLQQERYNDEDEEETSETSSYKYRTVDNKPALDILRRTTASDKRPQRAPFCHNQLYGVYVPSRYRDEDVPVGIHERQVNDSNVKWASVIGQHMHFNVKNSEHIKILHPGRDGGGRYHNQCVEHCNNCGAGETKAGPVARYKADPYSDEWTRVKNFDPRTTNKRCHCGKEEHCKCDECGTLRLLALHPLIDFRTNEMKWEQTAPIRMAKSAIDRTTTAASSFLSNVGALIDPFRSKHKKQKNILRKLYKEDLRSRPGNPFGSVPSCQALESGLRPPGYHCLPCHSCTACP